MTSLKKYLFVYNNKDASELGANPRSRGITDRVFVFEFLFTRFPPQSGMFVFASLLTGFGVNGAALCERMWLNFRRTVVTVVTDVALMQ